MNVFLITNRRIDTLRVQSSFSHAPDIHTALRQYVYIMMACRVKDWHTRLAVWYVSHKQKMNTKHKTLSFLMFPALVDRSGHQSLYKSVYDSTINNNCIKNLCLCAGIHAMFHCVYSRQTVHVQKKNTVYGWMVCRFWTWSPHATQKVIQWRTILTVCVFLKATCIAGCCIHSENDNGDTLFFGVTAGPRMHWKNMSTALHASRLLI
jgi:hypothetical protein